MPSFAIYSRKSRITERGESIENQVELCRRYINDRFSAGGIEAITIYEDEGFSGGNINRPAFLRLMADTATGKITHVVCYRLDRISRSIGDFAALIEKLRLKNIEFISIKEQFDTGTPIGRAMMYIASVFSQLERETIAERIRDNMAELAKSGRWLGGRSPLGYTSEAIKEQGKSVYYRLKEVPGELSAVMLIYEIFEETGTLSGTEKLLKSKGILTCKGRPFSRLSIKGILTNPVYGLADNDTYTYFKEQGALLCGNASDYDGSLGLMVYNKTKASEGKVQRATAVAEWIVSVGDHRGIIGGKRWTSVQRLLRKEARGGACGEAEAVSASSAAPPDSRPSGKAKGRLGLLAAHLRCPICNSPMRAKAGSANGSYYYRCARKGHSNGGCCNAENINGVALDDKVIKAAAQMLCTAAAGLPPEAAERLRRQLATSFSLQGANASKAMIKEKEAALCRLLSALKQSGDTPAAALIIGQINTLSEELNVLKQEKCHEGKTEQGRENSATSPALPDILQMLRALDTQKQRAVIFCILKAVSVY